MKPSVALDQSIILTQHDEIVNMLLELTAPPAPDIDRAPLDIALVVDRSGSMGGRPMAAVRRAVSELIRVAGLTDRIAVVAFDDEVETVLPLAHHDSNIVRRHISNIHSRGSTNLSGGWLKGFEILSTAAVVAGRQPAIKRIIVLTDGHANAGIRDHEELCTMTRGASAHGITTSMIGFADGYDETLLAAMADAGGGNDYWCAGPDQALNVFNQEFDGLASVVAQNLSVEIRPTDATAAFEVLNEYDTADLATVLGAQQVSIGDACGDEVRRLLVRFTLRPRLLPGAFTIANLTLRWASTIGSIELHDLSIPVVINATDNQADIREIDPVVTREVLLIQVANIRKAAIKAARHGDIPQARALFNQAISALTAIGADPREIEELVDLANRLEQFTEHDMKAQYSSMRSTNKGRFKRFD
jgi:Ca-activated chloride channel family protein